MRPLSVELLLAASLLIVPLAGCGSDRTERGLAPAEEESVPVDPADLDMTEEEREEQQEREEP
jgi:hypothetical protein